LRCLIIFIKKSIPDTIDITINHNGMASSPFSILNFGLIGDNDFISEDLSMTGMPLTEECEGEVDSTTIFPLSFLTTVSIVDGWFLTSSFELFASPNSMRVDKGAIV
jgi:hypothetical protein